MDFLNDEEIAAMEQQHQQSQEQSVQAHSTALAPPPPVPLYDPAQVPVLGTAPNGQPQPNGAPPGGIMGFAKQQWGPMPAWAWLLLGGSVAGAGYMFLKSKKPDGSDSSDDSKSEPKLGQRVPVTANAPASSASSWRPSRSEFAEKLQRYFDSKGMAPHVVVWHDAEDARDKGGMRIQSPLVNVQVKDAKAFKLDAALKRWSRREGLDPRMHQDGSLGFYPHSGKRGREWEKYIDDLRDDGQTI